MSSDSSITLTFEINTLVNGKLHYSVQGPLWKKSLFLLEKMPSQMEVAPCYELLTLLILFSLITLLTFFCLRFYFRSVQQTRMVDPFRVAAQQQNVSIISCSTSYEYACWPASRVSTTLIKRVIAAAGGARGKCSKTSSCQERLLSC